MSQVIFLTGATGFLGQHLLSVLLKSDFVTRIYVLIRNTPKITAIARFKRLIQGSECFSFLLNSRNLTDKCTVVPGCIKKKNLDIDVDTLVHIQQSVNVFIHCAANTTFTGGFKHMLDINVLGTMNCVHLCNKCTRMDLFLYVSTAYVDTYRQKRDPYLPVISHLNVCIDALHTAMISHDHNYLNGVYKYLQSIGFQNTYLMSKAICEKFLNTSFTQFGITIIRPSMIGCSYKYPYSGWNVLQQSGPMLLTIAVQTGILDTGVYTEDHILDLVPVDYVSNLICAVIQIPDHNTRIFYAVLGNYAIDTMSFYRSLICSYPKGTRSQFRIYGKTAYTVRKILLYDSFHSIPVFKILERCIRTRRKVSVLLAVSQWVLLTSYKFNDKNTIKLLDSIPGFPFLAKDINHTQYLRYWFDSVRKLDTRIISQI